MVRNPPEGTQRIVPYLYYRDARAAIEFLGKAFGLAEAMRIPGPGGIVAHAELSLGDDRVMIGTPMDDRGQPNLPVFSDRHGSVLVYVDDVDAHFARARAAGAKILSEPEDKFYGDRSYTAEDPEGHRWFFATHVKDVAPEDMKPPE